MQQSISHSSTRVCTHCPAAKCVQQHVAFSVHVQADPFLCDKDGGIVDDDDNRLWVQQCTMQNDTTEQGSPMFVKSDCG